MEIVNNNTQTEQWRMIAQAPNYQISNLGNVRNAAQAAKAIAAGKTPKNRSFDPNVEGYMRVTLTTETGTRHFAINRLVAFAFHGAPETRNHVVNHVDGNILNNSVSNLEWSATRSITGRINRRKFTAEQILAIRKAKDTTSISTSTLAKMHGVTVSNIANILKRKSYATIG